MNEQEQRTILAACKFEPSKVIEFLQMCEWSEMRLFYKRIFEKL